MGSTYARPDNPGQMVQNKKGSTHINVLKLHAVRNACHHFLPIIKNKMIKIMMDNIMCMFYINRQGEAKSHSLCTEAMKLWNWCIKHNINILNRMPKHNGGCPQQAIWTKSRVGVEQYGSGKHFLTMGSTCNRPLHENKKSKQKMSPVLLESGNRKGLSGRCIINWSKHLLYAFPPIPLIPRVIRYAGTEQLL